MITIVQAWSLHLIFVRRFTFRGAESKSQKEHNLIHMVRWGHECWNECKMAARGYRHCLKICDPLIQEIIHTEGTVDGLSPTDSTCPHPLWLAGRWVWINKWLASRDVWNQWELTPFPQMCLSQKVLVVVNLTVFLLGNILPLKESSI